MKTALILIDIQNDYFPGGKVEVVNSIGSSLKAKELLEFFREQKLPVIHVQHFSTRPGAAFLLPATEGSAIHENVKPVEGEPIVPKNYPNSFRETTLEEYLQTNEITQLVIGGMMSHMCIDTTVRAAFDKGYRCIVAHDSCATRDVLFNGNSVAAKDVHDSFMSALGSVFATVVSSCEVIDLLKKQ